MRSIFFGFFFLIFMNSVFAQQGQKTFWQLSGPEKCWVVFHPFIANKARKITAFAQTVSHEMKSDTLLDGDESGGQLDAFRHSFWMSLLAQKFSRRTAISLGKAHEKGNYRKFKNQKLDEERAMPDSVSGVMDLFNNETGVSIGMANKTLSAESLKILVGTKILNGEMRIISKNKEGLYLDCDGNVLDVSKSIRIWGIPKCLISSDRAH